MLSDHLPKGNAVLDASVIINLLGCGEPARVLSALGCPCIVETRTLREIQRHPEPGRSHETILQDLVSRELLVVVRMTDEEYENYLGYVQGPLASRLDDGESAAIAIAGRGGGFLNTKKNKKIYAPKYWAGYNAKQEYPVGIMAQEFIWV